MQMQISMVRNNTTRTEVQLGEIELVKNGMRFRWPASLSVEGYVGQYQMYGSSIYATPNYGRYYYSPGDYYKGPYNLFDGITDSASSVLSVTNRVSRTSVYPVRVVADFGKMIDISDITQWRWYTADNNPPCDPVSFSLEFSKDGENWIVFDSVANATITTNRFALAYTGNLHARE